MVARIVFIGNFDVLGLYAQFWSVDLVCVCVCVHCTDRNTNLTLILKSPGYSSQDTLKCHRATFLLKTDSNPCSLWAENYSAHFSLNYFLITGGWIFLKDILSLTSCRLNWVVISLNDKMTSSNIECKHVHDGALSWDALPAWYGAEHHLLYWLERTVNNPIQHFQIQWV